MSFMDTIRSWFGKAEDKVHEHGHKPDDHAHEDAAAGPGASMPPSSSPGSMPPESTGIDEDPPQSA